MSHIRDHLITGFLAFRQLGDQLVKGISYGSDLIVLGTGNLDRLKRRMQPSLFRCGSKLNETAADETVSAIK